MTIQPRPIVCQDGPARLECMLYHDTSWSQPRPGILVFPTWAGRDTFVLEKAQALAALGYVALAVDPYGSAQIGNNPSECGALMNAAAQDRMKLQARLSLCLESLRSQPEVDGKKMAAMGFCFGGLCALDLARSGANLQAAISLHGILSAAPEQVVHPIRAKVLVLHGFEDPMAPPEAANQLGQELTAAGADWQLHQFGNTQHAFTNPKANDPGFGTVFNPLSNQRSWRLVQDFLAEVLE